MAVSATTDAKLKKEEGAGDCSTSAGIFGSDLTAVAGSEGRLVGTRGPVDPEKETEDDEDEEFEEDEEPKMIALANEELADWERGLEEEDSDVVNNVSDTVKMLVADPDLVPIDGRCPLEDEDDVEKWVCDGTEVLDVGTGTGLETFSEAE